MTNFTWNGPVQLRLKGGGYEPAPLGGAVSINAETKISANRMAAGVLALLKEDNANNAALIAAGHIPEDGDDEDD